MCGRYTTGTEVENIRYREIIEQVNSGVLDDKNMADHAGGDVYPGDNAPIIYTISSNYRCDLMTWGMDADGKCIINARSETAMDKPMFANSMLGMRCIIPAMGYYEWNARKEKHIFRDPNGDVLMLAGLYRYNRSGKREFTILTREAYGVAAQVHGRMPLIMHSWEQWLQEPEAARALLRSGGDIKLDMQCLSSQQISMF